MAEFSVAVLAFSILATTFDRGFFRWASLFFILIWYGALWYQFLRGARGKSGKSQIPSKLSSNIKFLMVVVYALFLYFPGGIYERRVVAEILLHTIPLLLFPLVITYLISPSWMTQTVQKRRFLFLIAGAAIVRILMLVASPTPIIDVFTMLKEAPLALWSGVNPYTSMYSAVYAGVVPDYFTYWPVSILAELPFVLLTQDPRVLLVLADVGCAVLLYVLGGRSLKAELFSILYLFRPNSLFIIEQSWLASLEFFFLLLVFWFWRQEKAALLGICLGLLIGVKPHYLAIVPFVFILCRSAWKAFAGMLVCVVLTTIPFIVWNPSDFKIDTIDFFLRSPDSMISVPTHLSLSLNTAVYTLTRNDIPRLIAMALLGIVYTIVFVHLFKQRQQDSRDRMTYSIEAILLFFLSFYLLNTFSFINYYYLLSGLYMLWFTVYYKTLS